MIMPALLLQKPHAKSKSADHFKHLERRLQLWSDGNFESLLDEGRTIQWQFALDSHNRSKIDQNLSKQFANHMMEGRVKAALRLISQDNFRGTLSLDSTINSENPQLSETSYMTSILKDNRSLTQLSFLLKLPLPINNSLTQSCSTRLTAI